MHVVFAMSPTMAAGLRLNGLNIVPSEFDISFDNFRTMRRC
jgi:hypothetical protein